MAKRADARSGTLRNMVERLVTAGIYDFDVRESRTGSRQSAHGADVNRELKTGDDLMQAISNVKECADLDVYDSDEMWIHTLTVRIVPDGEEWLLDHTAFVPGWWGVKAD